MANKPFMEMDIDEFEDKNEEVIDEPNLDFDFDDDTEENTPSEDTSSSTEINDEMILSLPNDFWYKSENSTSDITESATDEDIVAAEKELGYKLPKAYKALIKQHNGGRLNRCICPTSSKTSWADDHAEISTLFGIDKNKPSIFATKFYQDEWGYPNIGLAIGSTPTAGHTMVFLDYSKCGHDGEPSVVDIDQENNYETSVLANDFEEFINKLITRDEFEKKQSQEDNTSDDSSETSEIPEEPNLDEPEVTQEAMFDAGFGNLRSKIAQALDGKFKVTNVGKGMNGKDSFTISGHIDEIGDVKTTVTNTGTGCEVISRGDEGFKRNFANISLSAAFEKIKELFDKPQLLFAEGYVMEAFGSTLAKEWIKKPEVIKEINDGIDQQFTSLFSFGIKPTETDLAENRKKILAKNIEPHILMSMYAKKSFDAMLKEEQRLEEEKMRKEMDEMVAKIMGRRNKSTQEAFGFGKLPFSRFYQEADEEETSDDEEILELPEMPDLDDDESNEEAPEDDTTDADTTEDESPDGLEGFGMDTSDVQNEFDPKDIDALNKLIAAESEAINDYFDASKDTRDEDLRTLFSDIGHEERFHLEQLMYAKSKLTGEKYEPRDPEVKAEYEELMNGGMDEETAAYTAMDKRSMLGEDDGDDSDMEELEQESAFITDALYRNEIITSQLTSNIINNSHDISKELGIIVEAFYQEAIDNVSSAPKEYTKIDSPLALLTKGLKVAVNGLTRMSAIIRDSMRKSKLTRARKIEWIKKHGIMELFKGGINLYLFDDNKNKLDLDTPCRYVDFLYRLTKAIGESCGVKLTAAAQHKTISNPIKFKNVDEGMYKLSQVIFNKTKVVVTDDNKAALQNEFFGYSDEKVNVKVTHGTDQVVNDSGNIYNRLDACILITKKYAEISIAVLDEIKKLEGDVNSVYYKNRTAYNKAMKNIKLVVDKYTQFIGAMSHDLTELMKLDNGLLKMTRERDMTEQGGGTWEGPDIRVSKQTSSGTQYTKRKK